MGTSSDHAVFVSYEHNDSHPADTVVQALEKADVKCWIAHRDMLGASRYGEALLDAIETSQLLLLLFSVHSNRSPMVDREVAFAASMGIRILPVRIATADISRNLQFLIGTHNWFDASTGPLSESIPRLVSAVQSLLSHTETDSHSPVSPGHHLVVFLTSTQATELWLTAAGLECYLYDFKAGEAKRQWILTKDQLRSVLKSKDIQVAPKSRYEDCGLFAIGQCKRWLYSKELFPKERALLEALASLVKAGAST